MRVCIHNASHAPISGAYAETLIIGPCVPAMAVMCSTPTNTSGVCNVNSPLLPAGLNSVTVVVTGINMPGYVHNPAAHHDPDGDSNGAQIIVTK